MIELNREMRKGGKCDETAKEITALSRLSDKISKYHKPLK